MLSTGPPIRSLPLRPRFPILGEAIHLVQPQARACGPRGTQVPAPARDGRRHCRRRRAGLPRFRPRPATLRPGRFASGLGDPPPALCPLAFAPSRPRRVASRLHAQPERIPGRTPLISVSHRDVHGRSRRRKPARGGDRLEIRRRRRADRSHHVGYGRRLLPSSRSVKREEPPNWTAATCRNLIIS